MTVAETAYGQLRGTEIADGIIAWRGVPYARPPVGELRLRPPQPPEPWHGVRDAAAYGTRSLQPDPLIELLSDPSQPPTDEDCLYLNVTAPAGATGRPVLFWIHGGGYEMGDATHQAGDGAAFARSHGIVVVTFNYRLGALGFLDVPGEQPAGALGLHDQIAALRWTKENIAAFGGDPDQITAYGLSAGGKTVTNLLASPLTTGLIRRAAESSGGDHITSGQQATRIAGEFFQALGTTPDRIRSVPAADILHAQLAIGQPPRSAWIWRPSVDGAALTSHPLTAIANGAAAQTERVLTEYFGAADREKLLTAYAADYPELDGTALRVAIMTDERYVIRSGRLADAQSAHAAVWRSRYDGPYTGLPDDPRVTQFAALLDGGHGLSAALHDAWGAFVTAGDPGWAPYTAVSRQAMIFGLAGPYLADDPFAPSREAWGTQDWQPSAWWSDH